MAGVALVAASIMLIVEAMMSLRRFERLYTMQMQAMTEIIYALAAARDEYYDDDDDTDEEEQPSKPELVAVIPFRSGSGEDKSDSDKDSKE